MRDATAPRVLITCDWFLKYALAQARGLASIGVPTAVLCRGHAEEYAGHSDERDRDLARTRQEGVEIFVLEDGPGYLADLASSFRLRSRIAEWQPTVIHAHEHSNGRFALSLDLSLPTLLTIHDPVPHPGQPSLDRKSRYYRHFWLRHAAAYHLHSERLMAQLPNPGRKSVFCVPHGMSVSAKPLPLPDKMVILMFGRLEPYKGLDVLASAMPRVWESHPHAELIIAGAGPTEFALVDDPRVTLRSGYIPEAEIADLFAAATVAVLPYTQASQSGVASVSLGLGVPVVASDIGGLPDLVETEWLSQPGDPLALAERLNRGLQHTYHHREEILGRVRALYSWDAVGLRFTTVYSELVVKRGRRHVTRRLGAARERNPWS